MARSVSDASQHGELALLYCGVTLPLRVLQSAAGYYIGTSDRSCLAPMSRESEEYFLTVEAAEAALARGTWTQRLHP